MKKIKHKMDTWMCCTECNYKTQSLANSLDHMELHNQDET